MHNLSTNIPILPSKYFILSDYHLEFHQGRDKEFWKAFPETQGAKVCICAGDFTVLGIPNAVDSFKELCRRFEKVIYVPGNHEYYGSDPDTTERRLEQIKYIVSPNLTVLKTGDTYTYKGQRFIGGTMWFVDKPEVHIYKNIISDYKQIKGLYPWCFSHSNLFNVFLRENVQEDDIVITHHIPCDVDTPNRWKVSPTQHFFLNDTCNRYISHSDGVKPKAWIYGHTHDYHNYKAGRTQFICNPVGYISERNEWKDKVIYFI